MSQLSNTSTGSVGSVGSVGSANDKEQFITKRGYSILRKIDSGGYGVVYKAKRNGELIAIKVVNITTPDKTLDADMQREVGIMKRVHHPNIIRTIDVLRTKSKLYFFMEYASGGNAKSYVEKHGYLSESQAKIVLFGPLASALAYLHEHQIAHRDLKLENILLDSNTVPKLSDFGLSRYFKRDKSGHFISDTFCGSPYYMSPEVNLHELHDPFLADIWSLGICLYVMLNDRYPFRAKDKKSMAELQVAKKWQFRDEVEQTISAECRDLMNHLLDPDPKTRYNMKQCLAHAWMPNINYH